MADPPNTPDPPLDQRPLTWAALLGGWIEFARRTLALPDDAEGEAIKATVGDVIMLQAVWFALRDLADLAPDQRALGLDRAAVLVGKHTDAIEQAWSGLEMPTAMRELIDDARSQLASAERQYRDDRANPDQGAT